MSKLMICSLLAFATLATLIPDAAFSAEKTTNLSTSLAKRTPQKSFQFSGSLLLETLAPVSTDNAGKRSYTGFYAASGELSHRPTFTSISLKIPYSREYSYERDDGQDGDFGNWLYSAKKKFNKVGFLDFVTLGISGGLPAGREAKHSTFNGSAGPSIAAKVSPGRFDFVQSVSYRYSFFRYDIQADGTVNQPHNYTSISDLTLNITKSFSATASFSYLYSRSFQNVGRSSTWSIFSLDYAITNKISTAVGFSTLKGTLSPDGQHNSISVFDPNSSVVFFDLTFST